MKATTNFSTQVPSFANNSALSDLLQSKGVTIDAKLPDSGPGFLESVLFGFGPTLLLILLFVLLMRRAASWGGAGGLMSFGRSRARRVEGSDQPVTFDDVAGIDEAKEELYEIVDFLKNPDKYLRLGGRIPRGVLLSGQPGTGKTLLARAVAGEAGVPFFQMSASEFVEMIVGVGASRVRDLFSQAKQAAPAIIFIDELDAVGRSRSAGNAGFSGGHDEREQTLNQILTEMDGFDPRDRSDRARRHEPARDPRSGAAAARPLRPPRRGPAAGPRRPRGDPPRPHPLGPAGQRASISAARAPPRRAWSARTSPTSSTRLRCSRPAATHQKVTPGDLSDSLERIVLGAERKVMLSEEDRRRTAFHEAGHAIVGMLTPGADPVRKVSIIPRGQALGVTFSAPDADRFNFDQRHLIAQIKVALGGRVAEEIVFGDLTTGAESDIQQLTRIARHMVGRWGMSRAIGPIAVLPAEGMGPLLPGSERDVRGNPAADRRGGAADRRVGPRRGLGAPPRAPPEPRLAGRRAARARNARRGRRLRRRRSDPRARRRSGPRAGRRQLSSPRRGFGQSPSR